MNDIWGTLSMYTVKEYLAVISQERVVLSEILGVQTLKLWSSCLLLILTEMAPCGLRGCKNRAHSVS